VQANPPSRRTTTSERGACNDIRTRKSTSAVHDRLGDVPTYRRPDEKKFCIVSESSSELLQGRVLKRLLEAKVEAMRGEQRRQTAMSPKNYEFRLVTYERTGDRDPYILEVTPRIKNKFLFRGRILVP
jgi:hypothetical protein